MEKRRMCPNCRAFITINDRVCPYCGAQLGPRAVDWRGSQLTASFIPRANLSSIILIAINCIFFLIEILVNSKSGGNASSISLRTLVLLGCKLQPLIAAGQWWRLITAGFLHGGFLHLAMNSYALFILVTEVEQFYGTARLIGVYVLSTMTGFWLSSFVAPGVPSIGASAGAFGLMGVMLAMTLRRRHDPLVQMIRSQYTQWIIFSFVLTIFPGRIDISAHIGGLLGGFIFGVVAGLPGLPNTSREVFWNAFAALAIIAVVFAFAMDFFSYRILGRQI